MNRLSLTARISLAFALAAAVVLLATGLYLARTVEAHFIASDREELVGHLDLIRHLLERVAGPEDLDRMAQELDDALVGHPGLAVAVVDPQGAIWFATSGADFPHALLRQEACTQPPGPVRCLPDGLRQWRQGGRDYRGMVVPVRAGSGHVHKVAVAQDIGGHESFMARFRILLGVAMALAALATAALGWLITHRGLAPLHRIRDLAAGISADHLAARLPEQGLPEELQTLAIAFNAMLARLDDAFRRLSEFSSDIAHELRTPIANLMTQTQVALSRARSAEEYREVLHSSAEEYERLARMVGDMLFLAKADNRLIMPSRETVDLAREASELIEFHGILAEEGGIRLQLAGAATVAGDRLMLRRALSNLLANAIRHCPAGESVIIRLAADAAGVVVTVENPGRIPAEHLSRLFDRFYTGDPARSAGGGLGLGLAIVRSIVEVHGGSIAAASESGRTRFVIRLPG
ncbi:MAG: heavy metal sensor histidine kinase [Gallionellaceae bacterium]|nr:heavy metal sensor histidine kinase [Gallionellaceae bacterium]